MKTINEQNKMIAEFMGFKPTLNGVYPITCPHEGFGFHIETMKYHWSWDWLMPVVERIDKVIESYEFPQKNGINNALCAVNLPAAFSEVVEIIEAINNGTIETKN